jgi:membrane-bound inhibitor of C-type lysozyme
MRSLAIATLAATLAACATPAEPDRTVYFLCDRGPALQVTFQRDSATVTPDGGVPIVLPQAPAGSGFQYQSPTHSLRGKGDEAMWAVGRMVPINCKAG